jgi:hypothetical protein
LVLKVMHGHACMIVLCSLVCVYTPINAYN